MKKEIKLIIAGLCTILVSIGVVFFFLYRFMDQQTERDIREIGRVFLDEKAHQEANRFEAIKSIRFRQMDSMKEKLEENGADADALEVRDSLAYAAEFQDLSNCSLISATGEKETVYGDPIVRLGDESFLMDSLAAGKDKIITGGWSQKEQLIIYASALSVPMTNGERSIGLLWCKPMSFFAASMNLDDENSLVSFHIIRRDTSYVVENDHQEEMSYDDVVLKYVVPEEMTAEEFVGKLHQTIAENGVFTVHTRYVDKAEGINIRRSVFAMPLSDSNWYLLAILPYGVLDVTISDMGQARMTGMLTALGILVVILLVVFFLYIQMTRTQVGRLEAARAEAEGAREDAEAASKAKSEFLSNMSHDIRTPMNAIVGMTAIASDHIDEKERVQDCLRKITISSQQLLGLINDILDMSKIESGKMTLKMEVVSLKQTMETMCEIVRPQIRSNSQNFDIIIHDVLSEEVYCDSVRLNQVLLNFLSNAMKFTPAGGSIQIGLSQEPSPRGEDYVRTHLSVSDTGIGMSEEFREKLFVAFEREDSRRVQKTQGTGLGMSITKYIVDAMGGEIEVISAPGAGSTFHVTVDLEKVSGGAESMTLPAWRILVVDDNEDVCRTASLSLTELGVKPSSCRSGEEAVELVAEAKRRGEDFFAVLIDYRLEGMNGIQTAIRIREVVGDEVPIRIISAYDWSDIEEEAAGALINGFIPKPLFKSTLYYELRKYADNPEETDLTASPQKQEGISGMRILLAEDNDLNAEIAMMILEESGCVVNRAPDGRAAASMFENSAIGDYDAILMDLRMPNMDGIEATRAIRAMDRSDASSIPIIAMTADAFAEDARKCMEAGMNAHLAKPIDVDQLTRTLVRLVRGN